MRLSYKECVPLRQTQLIFGNHDNSRSNGFTSTLQLMQEMSLKDSWIITITVRLTISRSLLSLHELHKNISLQRSACYGLLPGLTRHLNGRLVRAPVKHKDIVLGQNTDHRGGQDNVSEVLFGTRMYLKFIFCSRAKIQSVKFSRGPLFHKKWHLIPLKKFLKSISAFTFKF